MLTLPEKIIFTLALIATGVATWYAVKRIIDVITKGQGKPDWNLARKRLWDVLVKVATFQPVFRFRFVTSLFHAFVGWGFAFYLLVNVGDVLQAYIPGFQFMGTGVIGGIYRLLADVLSVAVLVGMTYFLVRRFAFKPKVLDIRDNVLVYDDARKGMRVDSAIVGVFILMHVGSRFVGESFKLALEGGDKWQPFATFVSHWWQGWTESSLVVGQHVAFWLALGLIMAFIPYFPYSKHIHLFFAPLNFLLVPERHSIGELDALDFEDESIEQFGATTFKDLNWKQLMDPYACIMCLRCQEVCPAYNTGKELSPAALEINKRYFIKHNLADFAEGDASETELVGTVISESAVWACTSCGACVDICPVGNEPMRDIMDIRRSLVLMENNFPKEWEAAFRGMERNLNPWGVPPTERMKWTEDLDIKVPTVEDNPEPDVLWWVGCAAATDARAQKTAQAFARILEAAGVNYAVLGENEQCCGDSARRAGNEYLFFELASANVEMLNDIKPKRIVTTCPHGLHTLKNEYPAFGGEYEVVHHTQFINELIGAGKLDLADGESQKVTFHDPCYLGRHNGVIAEPRDVLRQAHLDLTEMAHHGEKSFCCGAGGAQMWKEEEHGTASVNLVRFAEAKETEAELLAVGCPFCLTMMEDASKADGGQIPVRDVAEIIADRLKS